MKEYQDRWSIWPSFCPTQCTTDVDDMNKIIVVPECTGDCQITGGVPEYPFQVLLPSTYRGVRMGSLRSNMMACLFKGERAPPEYEPEHEQPLHITLLNALGL